MRERLQAVDPAARAGLSFAAAALRPSTELLLDAGLDRGQLKAALETGIVEADGERLSFAHPLLAAAAYELLLPDERREIHARLAAASTDVVERGHHVSRSAVAPHAPAAEVLDRAAEEAANLGDHAGAASFLLRAAELAPDPIEAATPRELQAARELELAGDVQVAAGLCRALIGRLPPGAARAWSRQLLVDCAVGPALPFEEALTELALALEDAGGDEAIQAELHVSIAEMASAMFRLQESVTHSEMAIELAERRGVSATAVAALSELGLAECLLGRGVTRAARLAFERWDESSVTMNNSPRINLALALVATTSFDEAEQLLRDELAMAEERGLEPPEALARGVTAELQIRAGRWAEALQTARFAVEHTRQLGLAQFVTGSCYALAMTEALLGRHEEARAVAAGALAEAEAMQDFWHTLSERSVLGLIALAEENSEEAVAVLEPAWRMMLESELGELSILPVAQVLGEAFVGVGRIDDSAEVAETLRTCPVGESPWCRAMSNRVAALVSSVRGDHDSARRLIVAALEANAELPEPFEHARTLQISGRVERSARNWGAARAALVDALERFDALGAARWSERTAADLARLPGRRPAGKQELTTREREIAELVAAGLANKEIAARLFVTVNTVEKTLSRAYAKLGVHSRTALAGRLHGSRRP
jgi:DNA-binding CsgD family transcriptional regulator